MKKMTIMRAGLWNIDLINLFNVRKVGNNIARSHRTRSEMNVFSETEAQSFKVRPKD